MKMPSVAPQHIKTVVGDHGLNCVGDTIVMGLQFASKNTIRRHPYADAELQRTRPAKMPSCIAGDPTGSIGSGRSTGPANHHRGAIMTTQPTPKGAWKITFLLFLFMLVNFADKIVVGLAGVPIMTELKLEPEQFGLLGSSFFFLFSISAIVVGFIVNRVATRWVLLVLAVIWALAQFPMLGSVSFTTLLICRVILGAGEGPAGSVAVHAVYKWFPDEKRTLPTAVLSQGSAFGASWALSLGLTWFTPFIIKGLGFSQQDAGWISILPWVFGAAIVLLTGWISQVMMARGISTRGARGVPGAVPLIVGGSILAALPHVDGAGLQVALLVVGSGLCGSIYVVCPPMLGEFTPVSQRGAVIAIYGAIYTLAGIVAPAVMGSVIQHAATPLEGYMTGFIINAVIMIASGLLGLLLLWPNTERARLMGEVPQPKFA